MGQQFTATLDIIFRRLVWEIKGVNIDGNFLNNLRFADDIFLLIIMWSQEMNQSRVQYHHSSTTLSI